MKIFLNFHKKTSNIDISIKIRVQEWLYLCVDGINSKDSDGTVDVFNNERNCRDARYGQIDYPLITRPAPMC